MTIEEFFTKKKIDLAAIAIADPALHALLHDHYTRMGEKSFDQVKKYHFNKWRYEYFLKEKVEEMV